MANIKHVGKTTGGQKVVVLFRTVPNEFGNCLITETAALPAIYHDRLMELVESDEGQQSNELADLLGRRFFSDGSNVLNTLHSRGYIKKVSTSQVVLTPNSATKVPLNELNDIISKKDKTNVMSPESYTTLPVLDTNEVVLPVVHSEVALAVTSESSNVLLQQAEFHEREAARLRALASSVITTTSENVKEVKRGRPPKTAKVG